MVINATTYADFKSVTNALTPLLSTPVVFNVTVDGFFFAWAVMLNSAVATQLSTGQPASFTNDFPAHITVITPISIQ